MVRARFRARVRGRVRANPNPTPNQAGALLERPAGSSARTALASVGRDVLNCALATTVLAPGHYLRPADIAVLASVGVAEVSVDGTLKFKIYAGPKEKDDIAFDGSAKGAVFAGAFLAERHASAAVAIRPTDHIDALAPRPQRLDAVRAIRRRRTAAQRKKIRRHQNQSRFALRVDVSARRARGSARDAPRGHDFSARPARHARGLGEPGHAVGEPRVGAQYANERLAQRRAKARDAFLNSRRRDGGEGFLFVSDN